MDSTTNRSLNDGKICQNFLEWELFYLRLCALLDLAQPGPVWSQFIQFVGQEVLNGSKSCTVGQNITLLYWLGPLGQFYPILRPFGMILGPKAWHLGQWGSNFSPFLLPKRSPKVPTGKVWLHSAPLVPFRPYWVAKKVKIGSQLDIVSYFEP